MKIGVWTPLPHTIRPEPRMEEAIAELGQRGGAGKVDSSFQFAVDFLQRAEACGVEISLIAERWLGPDLESWMLTSALAAYTKTMELMVAVHPGIVHPQIAAKMGATLDRISGGRFAVNIVNGWNEREFGIFGNGGGSLLKDSDKRYDRMEEFMRVMRGLWTDDVFSSAGAFFPVEDGEVRTRAMRQPCPPIYAASQAAAGKDAIAHYGDCWFIQPDNTFRTFDRVAGQARDAIAEMGELSAEYGRRVGVGLAGHVICTPTMEQAEKIAVELEQYGKGGGVSFIAANGLSAALVGTPEVVAERLDEYHNLGVDVVMLHFHPMMDGLDTFATEVAPKLDWIKKPGAAANV